MKMKTTTRCARDTEAQRKSQCEKDKSERRFVNLSSTRIGFASSAAGVSSRRRVSLGVQPGGISS